MATKVAIEVDVKVDGADKSLGKVKNELKGVEKQAKKSTDQIKSGFDAASKQATSLPGPVGRAAQAFQSMVGGIKKGVAALKTLKGALIATGLGALVVVVGSLVAYFTKTERGAQKLRIAMAAVGAAVGVVKDAMVGLGESFVQFFRGDFKGAVNTLKNSFTGLGDEIKKDVAAATELERAMNRVKVQERELGVERAKTAVTIAEARLAAEDETKSAEERIAKLKEAAALEVDLTARELANQEEKLRIMKEQAELNESDEATLQAIAEQEKKVAQVQLNSLNLNRRLKTELNSLEREIETERKQRAEEEQKRLEAEAAAVLKIAEAKIKAQNTLEEYLAERESLSREEMIQKEIDDALAVEEAKFQAAVAAAQEQGILMQEIDNLELAREEERLRLENEIRAKYAEEDLKREEELKAALAKLEDDNVKAVKDAETEKQRAREAGLSTASSVMNSLGQLVALSGNQSKEAVAIQKAFAVAQVAIDTAKAISAAIAGGTQAGAQTGVAAPITTPVFIASMIATVLGSLAQVSTILATVPGGGNSNIPSTASVPQSSAPSIQPVTTNTTELGGAEQAQLAPIQAYVVETEVTGNQNNVNQIESQATFGG